MKNSNNQKENNEVKEMKEMKETTNNSNEKKAMKEMINDTKTLEQQLQELEDQKKALKEQLTEQKNAERLEAQIKDKVVNLMERFAQIGVQLVANANAIFEGTKDENIQVVSLDVSKALEDLDPLFDLFYIDLQELRGNIKPLSARGNKTDRTPREQRKLADYGIKDGDRLIYVPTGDAYEVLENGVIIEGKRYSLSTAVKVLKNNPGGSYSGYKFFRLPDHTEVLEKTAVIS